MVKNVAPVVCILIVVLDVVAGILGIQAEVAQNKVQHLKEWVLECRDPSYQAFKLGLAASILMALAHVVANVLGGCVCFFTKEEYDKASANKQLAVASLAFSWIILVIGFAMLVSGTLANSKSRTSCGVDDHRLLSIGGILCFVHGMFLVAYCVAATAAAKEEAHTQAPPA
uniref:Uncharacterized protein n=1 Tax=Kalanchoe fedtschenkoi TaxID=63787 RepID=A0A7N0REK1_KALFE